MVNQMYSKRMVGKNDASRTIGACRRMKSESNGTSWWESSQESHDEDTRPGQDIWGTPNRNRSMVYCYHSGVYCDGRSASSSSSASPWTSMDSTYSWGHPNTWNLDDEWSKRAIGDSFGAMKLISHSWEANEQCWSNQSWQSSDFSRVDSGTRPDAQLTKKWSVGTFSSLQHEGDNKKIDHSYWSFRRSWDSICHSWPSRHEEATYNDFWWVKGQQAVEGSYSWGTDYYSATATVDNKQSHKSLDITHFGSNHTNCSASSSDAIVEGARRPPSSLENLIRVPKNCGAEYDVGVKTSVPWSDQQDGEADRSEVKWGLTPFTNGSIGFKVRASSLSAPLRLQREAVQKAAPGGVDPWANFTLTRSASVGRPLGRSPTRRDCNEPFRPLQIAARMAVMLEDAVELLMQGWGPDATYVDCTFGRGGHASEILRRLSPKGRLIGFDMDPVAIAVARGVERSDTRFKCYHRPHGDLPEVIDERIENLGGVLIDLGSQASQAEERSRGFSVVEDGPLDLRLNPEYGMPASEWLQCVSVQELAWVIHEHGEDSDLILSKRLAEGILQRQCSDGPYKSTLELADVCRDVKQGIDDRGQHPAKLTFQAIRTFLNHEVEQLDLALIGAMQRLQPGGRCVIITYRRREAAQVKRFLREHEEADPRFAGFVTVKRLVELYPLLATDLSWSCRQSCEPLRASPQECERNPRARAALVHVLTKQARDFTQSPCRDLKPRAESEQFKKPAPLPFEGATNIDATSSSVAGCSTSPEIEPKERDERHTCLIVVAESPSPERAEQRDDLVENVPSKDWLCPQCGDLQWARRPRCRLCGGAPGKTR